MPDQTIPSHFAISDHGDRVRDLVAGSVDVDRGVVSRRIFADPNIYEAELERVFRRCWLFLGHETQIPNAGDYFTCKMGETPVIVVRDAGGTVRALINSCRHRGNAVTRTDAGCARTFTCPYHGWTYDLQGKRLNPGSLVGMPGLKTYYDDKLDLESWGLIPVTQIASYHGLIFGNFDPDAPSLAEYLGDFRWVLDLVLDRGDFAAVPGIVRWRTKCNWKFAADNAIGDNAHVQVAHRSAIMASARKRGTPNPTVGVAHPGFTILTEYGHGVNCQTFGTDGPVDLATGLPRVTDPAFSYYRTRPELIERQGSFRMNVWRYNANVFPNLFMIDQLLMLRNPIGPGETEIYAIALYDRSAPPHIQEQQRRKAFQRFGPSGLLEQEDGENWEQATTGTHIREMEDAALNYEMGLGGGRFVHDEKSPPRIESLINEHGQMWFYRFWTDAMSAPGWTELREHHARPRGTI